MQKINIHLPHKEYEITIQKGLLYSIGEVLKKQYEGKKIAIITDSNVDKIYGETMKNQLKEAGFKFCTIVVDPGEKSKSLEGLQRVYDDLIGFGITRGDLIIAFGGGVIGDLAGFAAATYLRGIPFIQVPTSLIAQIDSSIGGKVAINLPQGKNLIGAFYHPDRVLIDPQLLNTLEKRYFSDGMGEVIKYGAIKDAKLFSHLLEYQSQSDVLEHIEEIISTCCNIKKDIVEADERDQGERMLLNFGHTIGHAVENYFNYNVYTHGEAVAIGMYQITKNSERKGITEKSTADLIKKVLIKYHLPYETPKIESEELLKIIKRDKKGMTNTLHIIILQEIGKSMIKKVSYEELREYIS